MINFTSEIKRELMAGLPMSDAQKKALLSALLSASGQIVHREGETGFELVTESEGVADYFTELFASLFAEPLAIVSADMDRLSGRDKLRFSCLSDRSEGILRELGFADRELSFGGLPFFADEAVHAALSGAFLGGGSCTLPSESESSTGYHLEVAFSDRQCAEDFCELVMRMEIFPKLTERKGSFVFYLQSKESISDFLYLVGARQCLDKLFRIAEERDRNNRINRANNCLVGNMDKSAVASAAQCVEIVSIRDKIGFDSLETELRETAEMRLAHPEASYRELSERLGITKSCLSRRLKRLSQIAKKTTEEQI